MGSTGTEYDTEDEINVYVTGFAPFRAQFPVNPSWEIAARLPPFLPPSRSPQAPHHRPVRIHVYPKAVHVGYDAVRELVPKLWEEPSAWAGPDAGVDEVQLPAGHAGAENSTGANKNRPRIDLMLHIGMAAGRSFYSIERRGHRDGYKMKDVDEKLLEDEKRHAEEGDQWIWHGCPEELIPDLDVDDIWRRWTMGLPGHDVRPSGDAGRYLCDFIYYSSLSHLWKKNEQRRVMFLHVPARADDSSIKTGVEITIELIRAIVASEVVRLKTGAGDAEA